MPRSKWLTMAAALAVAIGSVSGAASAREFKRISDISVSCTDGLTCDVSAYNAQSELYTLIFRRAARPAAPVRLVLGVRETLTSGSDVGFSIDGQPLLTIPVSELSYRAAVYEYTFDGEAEIAALIAAAKAGDEMRVTYRSRGLDTVSAFSLDGFVEGLIFMDQVQGRVGRDDALYAEGAARVPGDLEVREIAGFDDIPFQIRAAFSDRPGSACGGLTERRFRQNAGFEARTQGDAGLIALPCGAGEAYNQAYAFWERTGSSFRRLALPVMAAEGPTTDTVGWNITWDQESQELTGLFKGREAGDCGVFNRWIWASGTGRHAFVLVEARANPVCDGTSEGGPEDWALLWPPAG